MRRDLNLLRAIMMVIETSPDTGAPTNWREQIATLGWDDEATVQEHCTMLIEAGLLAGSVHRDSYSREARAYIMRITHAGHDFVDVARSDAVWHAALDKLEIVGGAATLSMFHDVLVATAREMLGLPPLQASPRPPPPGEGA